MDDETGLYYYGARYYNPATSVWLSVDAMASKGPNITPYAFSHNNPVMLVDPDGNWPYSIFVRSFESSPLFAFPFTSLGDGRNFSTQLNASSRIQYQMDIETSNHSITNCYAFCGQTVQLAYPIEPFFSPQTDKAIPEWSDHTYKTHAKGFYGKPGYSFQYSAAEPVMAKQPIIGPFVPSIDVGGHFIVEETNGVLNIQGSIMGDAFPDAESFITDSKGTAIMIGVFKHSSLGSPIWSLMGNTKTLMMTINTRIELDSNGNFMGVYSYDENGNDVVMSPQAWEALITQ